MSIGSFFRNIGKGVARVGSFIRRGAERVGDFVSKVDMGRVGDISRGVRDVASTIAGLGIPVLSSVAGVVGRGADIVSRVADRGQKIKEGVDVARQVGEALERPREVGGIVKAGKRAYEYGKSLKP